jgi:hypothetical protein
MSTQVFLRSNLIAEPHVGVPSGRQLRSGCRTQLWLAPLGSFSRMSTTTSLPEAPARRRRRRRHVLCFEFSALVARRHVLLFVFGCNPCGPKRWPANLPAQPSPAQPSKPAATASPVHVFLVLLSRDSGSPLVLCLSASRIAGWRLALTLHTKP